MENKKLKVIFAGTPQFAVPTLELIHDSGFNIPLVLTQPDRKSGRGMAIKQSPVKKKAIQLGINVYQPENIIKNTEVLSKISSHSPDILIVAAYGLILSKDFLRIFPKESFNVHASLLPRWRGAAPIHRAIENGDKEVGVTIMNVIPKLDAGAMIKKRSIVLKTSDNTGLITEKLSKIGAKLMLDVLEDIEESKMLNYIQQDEKIATYAKKVSRPEAELNINDSVEKVLRKINAFNPYPGIFSIFRKKTIKIWEAEKTIQEKKFKNYSAGDLVVEKKSLFLILTSGVIKINKIQIEGSRILSAIDFISGYQLKDNENFL
jgi:methionyl-tRNA formyltransferase